MMIKRLHWMNCLDNLILDSKPDTGDDAAMQGTVDDTAVRTLVGEVPTAVDGMVLIGEGRRKGCQG